jgi:hypothetical protein
LNAYSAAPEVWRFGVSSIENHMLLFSLSVYPRLTMRRLAAYSQKCGSGLVGSLLRNSTSVGSKIAQTTMRGAKIPGPPVLALDSYAGQSFP